MVNTELMIEQAYSAYGRGDLEAVGASIADDIVYVQYVDREIAPFGGVSIGKAVLLGRFGLILELFEIEQYRLTQLRVDGETGRSLVEYRYRHRLTGEVIAGHLRHELWLRDGLVARYHEYLDRPRVEAFMRLVAQSLPTSSD